MRFIDALYEVSKLSGTPTTRIGLAIGKNREYVSKIKSNNADPSTANAARLLEACGWKLVAVPSGSAPDDAIEITPASTTDEEKADALRRQAETLRKQADKLIEQADGRM